VILVCNKYHTFSHTLEPGQTVIQLPSLAKSMLVISKEWFLMPL